MKERAKSIMLTALILLVFGALFSFLFHQTTADAARRTHAIEFYEHVGARSCQDWDQQSLTASSSVSVQTDCLHVESCVGSIHSMDTGASAPVFFCNIPTQTGANIGKVTMNVDVPGSVASGTTVVNWAVFG